MATVIGARFSTVNADRLTNAYDWLIEQIPSLLDYALVETVSQDETVENFLGGSKIYISDHTFLYIYRYGSGGSASTYRLIISAGTDSAGDMHINDLNGILHIDAQHALYIELVKSDKGDVLISTYQPSTGSTITTVERGKFRYAAIVKCHNIVTDDHMYGVVFFKDHAMHYVRYLITDDTDLILSYATDNTVCPDSSGGTTQQILYTGMNTNAKITVLMPITGVASECVTENCYTVLFTPSWLVGNAELNGKRYYFAHQFVMLDE